MTERSASGSGGVGKEGRNHYGKSYCDHCKRSGHASFEDLIDQGFITEAIVNYVALLGWSPEDNREIFSLDELIKEFDYHRISKSPAVFDIVKLRWMNGEYLKAMDFDKFYEMAEPREIRRCCSGNKPSYV